MKMPQKLLTKFRKCKAAAKAPEATKSPECPCKLRGWVGQEEGEEITTETKLSYERCAIRTGAAIYGADQLPQLSDAGAPSS